MWYGKGCMSFSAKVKWLSQKPLWSLLVFHPKVLPAGGRTAARAELGRSRARKVSSGETSQAFQRAQWGVHLRTVTWTPSIKRASISLQSKSRKLWLSLEGEVQLWFGLVLLPPSSTLESPSFKGQAGGTQAFATHREIDAFETKIML